MTYVALYLVIFLVSCIVGVVLTGLLLNGDPCQRDETILTITTIAIGVVGFILFMSGLILILVAQKVSLTMAVTIVMAVMIFILVVAIITEWRYLQRRREAEELLL